MAEETHDVSACYILDTAYRRHIPCLECSCGFVAKAATWEDAGLEFDEHIADVDKEEPK